MKKVLGIIVSRTSDDQRFYDSLMDVALRKTEDYGAVAEKINLCDYNILQCRECNNCDNMLPCPQTNSEGDQVVEILNRIAQADALIMFFSFRRGKAPELAGRLLSRITSKNTDEDSSEKFYSKIFQAVTGTVSGKETGIIYTGETATVGAEVLWLFNSLDRLKLNLMVSAGIRIEENNFPGRADNRNSDNDYSYALRICEAVGERIGICVSRGTLRHNAFKDNGVIEQLKVKQKDIELLEQSLGNIDEYSVYDVSGHKIALKVLLNGTSIFIIGGPMAIDQNLLWIDSLNKTFGKTVNIYPIAEIDQSQLPVPKDFILGKIKDKIVEKPVYVDWDVCFNKQLGIDYTKNYSTIIVINSQGTISYKLEEIFSAENSERVSAAIKKSLIKKMHDTSNINNSQINKIYVNGLNVSYMKAGRGQPVLIIHGNRDKKDYFSSITKALEQNYEVYAIDLRGHGNSDKPESGYNLEEFLEDIRQFIIKMKFGSLNIIGHSLGATLAMKTALNNPNVENLILLGASANFHPSFRPENIRVNSIDNTNLNEDAVKDAIQNSIAPYFFLEEYPDVKEMITRHWREIPSYMQRALVMELKHPDMREEISAIKSKTLVIAGEKDRITTVEQCKYVAEKIKGSELKIIQGAGHFMFLEKPDEVISVIGRFLEV